MKVERKTPSFMLRIIILLILFGTAFAIYKFYTNKITPEKLLYGNVDYNEIELAFLDSERVSEIYVQEGDKVSKGQILAKLHTNRLENNIDIAKAKLEAAKANYEKLKNGTRPEEITQAKAAVEATKAQADFANSQYKRAKELYERNAVSKADYEQALQQVYVTNANLELEEKNLELAKIGPRKEDIAQVYALMKEAESFLNSLYTQLDEASLKSPVDSVVNRRLLEVGDIATPQKAIFSLAVLSPKWVRAYISEPQLGRLNIGMKADIYTDSFPNNPLQATLGFISSVAEFTPKQVETAELRTALVYEVRFYLEDKENILRLGMPVTVELYK